jgi:apolipoprotein N-acyltransferase
MRQVLLTGLRGATATRYAWSALAGLCLAAAFPKIGIAGLAWVAPGAMLFAALGGKGGDVFRVGYVGGYAYALAAFYWILLIPFPPGAIAGWFALSAYVALYPATWVWLCWKTFPAAARADSIQAVLSVTAFQRVAWAFSCAVLWVALEMVLARLFTGFPWNLLGVSQYQILPVIQIAGWTGVYGISFLIIWFSVGLAAAAANLMAKPTRTKGWVADLVLPLVVLLVVIAYGSSKLSRPQPPPSRTLKAVLVQPSIPQTLIWDKDQSATRFKQLIELSDRALTENTNAQLLVWPEAAVPNMLRYEAPIYQAVTNIASGHRVWVILGSDDAAPHEGEGKREYDYFNSSFLVSPRGELVAAYQKRRLVIFGEYIPLERWLPMMKFLTPVGGSFTAGTKPSPFTLGELEVKTSVLICFEDIFPHIGREYVEEGTDFLLNLTNNGWFGESAAQWQHAANAVFRTVENGIPLVRCANNGLTCLVDTFGRIHQAYFPGTRDIYGAGYKVVDIPLLGDGQRRSLTFYTRHGDWFGWGCVGLAVVTVTLAWVGRKRFAVAQLPSNR